MQFKEKIQLLAESFTLKEDLDPLTQKPTGVKIQGLAITPDKPTRNKVAYSRESLMATHKSLIGKPFLDSHQDTSIRNSPPFGHVTNTWMTEKGMFYEVDIDPAEQVFINKAKRGDISGVSIQVLVEDVDQQEGFVRANVQEFLELSAVLIPGDGDTSMKIAEAFKNKEVMHDDVKNDIWKMMDMGLDIDSIVGNVMRNKRLLSFGKYTEKEVRDYVKSFPKYKKEAKIDPKVKKKANEEEKKYIKGPSVKDAEKDLKSSKPKDMMDEDPEKQPNKTKIKNPKSFMKRKGESLIKSYNLPGYDYVELRQGSSGNGKPLFIVQSQRTNKAGKKISAQEEFKTKEEAERWIRSMNAPKEMVKCPICRKEINLKDNSKEIIMLEKHETYEEFVSCPHCKTELKLKEQMDIEDTEAQNLYGKMFDELTPPQKSDVKNHIAKMGKEADVTEEVPQTEKPIKMSEEEDDELEESELDTQPLPIPEEEQPMRGVGEIEEGDGVDNDEVEPPMPDEQEEPIIAPDAQAEPVMDVEQPPQVPMGDEQELPMEDGQQIDGQEIPMEDEVKPMKYKLQIPHFGDKYFDSGEAVDEDEAEKMYYDLRKKGKMPRIVDIETGECVMEALDQGTGTQPQAGSGKGKGNIQKPNDKNIGSNKKPVAGTPSMPNAQEPAEDEELSGEVEDASMNFNPLNGCKVCGHKPLDGEGDGKFECPNCNTVYKLDKDGDEYEYTTPNPTEVNKESFILKFECLDCKHKDVDDRFPEQTDGLVYCPKCQGVNLESIKENKIGGR